MPERIVVRDPGDGGRDRAVHPWDWSTASRAVGWIGAVLLGAALVDFGLAFTPLAFGTMEWEFGTISEVFAGLPLLSVGLAGLWLSAAGRGRRWMTRSVGVLLLLSALCVCGLLVVFLTDAPVAVRATQGVAQFGIKKVIAKTSLLGLLFGVAYSVAGVIALRQSRGSTSSKEAGV